jgi:hypothetical protein
MPDCEKCHNDDSKIIMDYNIILLKRLEILFKIQNFLARYGTVLALIYRIRLNQGTPIF